MSAICHKCSGGAIDALSGECLDCADAARLAELEATVALLEAENARLKTDLGAASFIASERTRNGIVKWLRDTAQSVEVALNVDPRLPDHNREAYVSFARSVLTNLGNAIAACEDINPP